MTRMNRLSDQLATLSPRARASVVSAAEWRTKDMPAEGSNALAHDRTWCASYDENAHRCVHGTTDSMHEADPLCLGGLDLDDTRVEVRAMEWDDRSETPTPAVRITLINPTIEGEPDESVVLTPGEVKRLRLFLERSEHLALMSSGCSE